MKNKLKAVLKYPAVLLFFAFILFYSLADSMVNNRRESELENRKLAQKPAMTVKNLLATKETEKFSYLYEQYINDQFLGRDNWISLKSRAESVLLKQKTTACSTAKRAPCTRSSSPWTRRPQAAPSWRSTLKMCAGSSPATRGWSR